MTITTLKLTRAAGLAAVVAGLLFILIQPIHPSEDVATVTSGAWAAVGYMTLAFAILGLIGVSGMYLRQVAEAGVLGLIGYVMFAGLFLVTVAFNFAEILILPPLASHAPQFVDSFFGIYSGSAGAVDLPGLEAVWTVTFVLYLVGGSLFGVALFRARVLARWAAAMLVFGALATLLIPLLPHSVARYAAVPMGVALIGLGSSLWTDRRGAASASVPGSMTARLDLAAAE